MLKHVKIKKMIIYKYVIVRQPIKLEYEKTRFYGIVISRLGLTCTESIKQFYHSRRCLN